MSAAVEMSPADVLEAAADYIDEHGWIQGDYEGSGGCVCAVGAIASVLGLAEFDTAFNCAAYEVLGDVVDPGIGDVTWWNDRDERTADEVTGAMRKVAADLRAEATA